MFHAPCFAPSGETCTLGHKARPDTPLAFYRTVGYLSVIRTKMEILQLDLTAAAALVFSEDLRAPHDTAARVASHLEEDFSDNPHLKD
jgi:hypothetical protein